MKRNWKSNISAIMEYLVLIAPTAGYSIYCYEDTLQYTMSSSSKGTFWTLIGIAILASVIYKIFKTKYDRYVAGYIQQKTDLETHPTDELLIKKVAEKENVVANLDYIIILLPILIIISVLSAFANAIENLMLIFEIMAGSIAGKISLHCLTTYLKKSGMLDDITKTE